MYTPLACSVVRRMTTVLWQWGMGWAQEKGRGSRGKENEEEGYFPVRRRWVFQYSLSDLSQFWDFCRNRGKEAILSGILLGWWDGSLEHRGIFAPS